MPTGPIDWTTQDLDNLLNELLPPIRKEVTPEPVPERCPRCEQPLQTRAPQPPSPLARCPHCGQLLKPPDRSESTGNPP